MLQARGAKAHVVGALQLASRQRCNSRHDNVVSLRHYSSRRNNNIALLRWQAALRYSTTMAGAITESFVFLFLLNSFKTFHHRRACFYTWKREKKEKKGEKEKKRGGGGLKFVLLVGRNVMMQAPSNNTSSDK